MNSSCKVNFRSFTTYQAIGDAEKQHNIPVTNFMNREMATEASISQTQVNSQPIRCSCFQVNFIQFVAGPTLESFNAFKPIPELMANLEFNRDFWSQHLSQITNAEGAISALAH